MPATEAALAKWRSIGGLVTAPQSSADTAGEQPEGGEHQQLQQRKFFDAFQAAVDQHTGSLRLMEAVALLQLGEGESGRDNCAANRKAAIVKFREKRKARNFEKKVRYESRRRLAEARPRVRGQFVRADAIAAGLADHPELLAM
ncbi:Two-component response regulator-like PRR37 [Sticta canariensis]|nr:Two-component response regulator-like PRR37 [Sticta canariensis]